MNASGESGQAAADGPPLCLCGHDKGEHLGRMDDCQAEGCHCVIYHLDSVGWA